MTGGGYNQNAMSCGDSPPPWPVSWAEPSLVSGWVSVVGFPFSLLVHSCIIKILFHSVSSVTKSVQFDVDSKLHLHSSENRFFFLPIDRDKKDPMAS